MSASPQPSTRRVASSTSRIASHGVDLVGERELVDVDDAVGDVVVVDEDVQDEAPAPGDEQHDVERCASARPPPGFERVEQEDERQREQQVRAAEEIRFGRPERRDVHVVERHRDRDDGDQPLRGTSPAGGLRLFLLPPLYALPACENGAVCSRPVFAEPSSAAVHRSGFFVELRRARMERHADVLGHLLRREPADRLVHRRHVLDARSHHLGHRVDRLLGQVAGDDDVRRVADHVHGLVLLGIGVRRESSA